jgi:hypothetical protein
MTSLLLLLSQHIPGSVRERVIGLVACLEKLSTKTGLQEFVENFLTRFPTIHDQMLILPAIRERQLETRTVSMEVARIARTRRVNEESVDFLLKNLIARDALNNTDAFGSDDKRALLNAIHDFAIANPQTLGLLLYSRLYEHFFEIHPSPNIISCELTNSAYLFERAIELTRDISPSVSRAALTALKCAVEDSILPGGLLEDELQQYQIWLRPSKKRRQLPDDSSWISVTVCKVIAQLTPGYPSAIWPRAVRRLRSFCSHLSSLMLCGFPKRSAICLTVSPPLRTISQTTSTSAEFF